MSSNINQRTGLIFKKIGCSALFNVDGIRSYVTVLHLGDTDVLAVKSQEVHGYNALQIGTDASKEKHLSKSIVVDYKKRSLPLKKKIVEFRISKNNILKVGQKLYVNHFIVGQFVDVKSKTIGKGFAGVMKRYNFSGMPASHGTSAAHRSPGSTGQCQDPGRVFPGKKMPGQMGNKMATIQNLKILLVDMSNSIICVQGSVPGAKNSYVIVRDAIKKNNDFYNLPFPTKIEANS